MYMVFFFFKQKTAYEMRISDWSSDVCSSDLTDLAFDPQGIPAQPAAWRQGHQASQQPRRRSATTAEGLDALGPANAMDTAVMPSDLRPGKARRRNLDRKSGV